MEILENMEAWRAAYEQGWLAHYQTTGETNWKLYVRARNSQAPAGPGIELSRSRLALLIPA